MKIKYTFANGDVSIVEVDEEIGNAILQDQLEEDEGVRIEVDTCCSLESLDPEQVEDDNYHRRELQIEAEADCHQLTSKGKTRTAPTDDKQSANQIKYEFADGEVSTVEVSDEIAEVILQFQRSEKALSKLERRHTLSLDCLEYESEELAYCCSPEDEYIHQVENEELQELVGKIKDLIPSLTPTQQRRLQKRIDGMSLREIADQEGVSLNAVVDSINWVAQSVNVNNL